MRLETKLSASTALVILTMLCSVFVAHLRIREADRLYETVTAERLPIMSLARDIRFAPIMSVRALEAYMLFGLDPESSARFRQERRDRLAGVDVAFSRLLDPTRRLSAAETVRIREFQAGVARLRSLEDETERLNELHTPESSSQAYDLLQKQVLPLEQLLFTSLDELVTSQEAVRDGEMAHLRQTDRSVLTTLWSATILGALCGGLISILLARRMARGVQLLVKRANAIASGDLSGEPLDIRSAGQIAALAPAIQQMQESLVRMVGNVAETAGTLTSSAHTIRSASDQVRRRVDEQSRQTQHTATAMQLMTASIIELSCHLQAAAESARSAAQTAREGGFIVRQMVEAMRSIRSGFSETSHTVSLLGDDSRRISQVVTMMTEITRKTTLLALNAAVEAARPGEQGRGFTGLAGEVRQLAESTASATNEIAAMIQAVQSRANRAMTSMTAGIATLEAGVSTANHAGDALERIIGASEQVESLVNQIAIAAVQQATAADRSHSALDSIHTLSKENLRELATTAATVESLQRTAATLERQVERFLLTPPEGSAAQDSAAVALAIRQLRASFTAA